MVNLDPFHNPLVPFVVERIGQLNGQNEFSIDVKSEESCPVINLQLPQEKAKICNMIKKHMSKYPAKMLKDLRYFDLLFDEVYCNGVYIFFEGDKCAYVGSSASRCIVDRVGGHLGLRQRDYLNSMVKYLAMQHNSSIRLVKDVTSADITNPAVLNSLAEMSILFIPVKCLVPDGEKQRLEAFKKQVELLEDFIIALCKPNLQMGAGRNGKYNKVLKKYKWNI